MGFVAFYDLSDYLDEAAQDGCLLVRAQPVTTSRLDTTMPLFYRTSIIVISRRASDGMIHLARVVVEELQQMSGERDSGLSERSRQALSLVEDALRTVLPGVHIRPGILLDAGLSDDLQRIHTVQDLWRIEQAERGEPRSRRLVAL